MQCIFGWLHDDACQPLHTVRQKGQKEGETHEKEKMVGPLEIIDTIATGYDCKIVLYFYFDTWSVLIGLFDFLSEFYSGPHNFHHSQYHGFRDNLHQVIISPSQM